MQDRARARLTRWLYLTSLPVPYFLRVFLINTLVSSRPARFRLPFCSLQMELDLTDSLQSNLYIDGFWEKELSNWLAFFASQLCPSTIADIGAQVGYFTLLMNCYAPNATIHAFEPNPSSFARLQNNSRLNGIPLAASQLALSDGEGVADFHIPYSLQLGTARLGYLPHAKNTISTQITSLDTYMHQHGLAAIELLKMDIEGGEVQAFAGMKNGLAAHRYGVIIFEFHRSILSLDDQQYVLNILHDGQYSVYEIGVGRLTSTLSPDATQLCAISPDILQRLGQSAVDIVWPADFRPPYPTQAK